MTIIDLFIQRQGGSWIWAPSPKYVPAIGSQCECQSSAVVDLIGNEEFWETVILARAFCTVGVLNDTSMGNQTEYRVGVIKTASNNGSRNRKSSTVVQRATYLTKWADMVEARLRDMQPSYFCPWLQSEIVPSIMTWSASGTSAPTTLKDFRLVRDFSRWCVPNMTASDLVGLRAKPFSQNQESTEAKHDCTALIWLSLRTPRIILTARQKCKVECRLHTAAEWRDVNERWWKLEMCKLRKATGWGPIHVVHHLCRRLPLNHACEPIQPE